MTQSKKGVRHDTVLRPWSAGQSVRQGSVRVSRNVKNDLSNETRSHCVSLDTDRRRRRKGADEDDSVRLQGKRCPVGPRRRRSSRSIRVELQEELAYRSERRVTKTQRLGIQCGW